MSHKANDIVADAIMDMELQHDLAIEERQEEEDKDEDDFDPQASMDEWSTLKDLEHASR